MESQQDLVKRSPEQAGNIEKIVETHQERRAGLFRRVVSGGLDIVPGVGMVKTGIEAIAGRTMGGRKLTGTGRLVHAGLGLTGVGGFVQAAEEL